jgi:maltose-binding protein MalE
MDADVRNTTEDFFGDSPIGRTYIENIRSSGNAPGGPEFRMVLREFRAAVRRVEQGIFAPDEAWTDALQRIDQLLD